MGPTSAHMDESKNEVGHGEVRLQQGGEEGEKVGGKQIKNKVSLCDWKNPSIWCQSSPSRPDSPPFHLMPSPNLAYFFPHQSTSIWGGGGEV